LNHASLTGRDNALAKKGGANNAVHLDAVKKIRHFVTKGIAKLLRQGGLS
jgi:hypothetical protein